MKEWENAECGRCGKTKKYDADLEPRPKEWGRVELRNDDDVSIVSRDVCPECFDAVHYAYLG